MFPITMWESLHGIKNTLKCHSDVQLCYENQHVWKFVHPSDAGACTRVRHRSVGCTIQKLVCRKVYKRFQAEAAWILTVESGRVRSSLGLRIRFSILKAAVRLDVCAEESDANFWTWHNLQVVVRYGRWVEKVHSVTSLVREIEQHCPRKVGGAKV